MLRCAICGKITKGLRQMQMHYNWKHHITEEEDVKYDEVAEDVYKSSGTNAPVLSIQPSKRIIQVPELQSNKLNQKREEVEVLRLDKEKEELKNPKSNEEVNFYSKLLDFEKERHKDNLELQKERYTMEDKFRKENFELQMKLLKKEYQEGEGEWDWLEDVAKEVIPIIKQHYTKPNNSQRHNSEVLLPLKPDADNKKMKSKEEKEIEADVKHITQMNEKKVYEEAKKRYKEGKLNEETAKKLALANGWTEEQFKKSWDAMVKDVKNEKT